MKKSNRIISPLKIFGGKSYLVPKIIPAMKYNRIFIEGFSDGCSISLNIEEHFDRHICIDKNPEIINFWTVLKSDARRLYKFMQNTEYSEENFNEAKSYLKYHSDEIIEPFFHAVNYLIANRMSRGADMKTYGWSERLRRGVPEYLSAYNSMRDNLFNISRRVQNIEFVCDSFSNYMLNSRLCKNNDVTIYIDPPYLHETRTNCRPYGRYEMTYDQHEGLLKLITREVKCITHISGYESILYCKYLGLPSYKWSIANSASQKKEKPIKEECLWVV